MILKSLWVVERKSASQVALKRLLRQAVAGLDPKPCTATMLEEPVNRSSPEFHAMKIE